MPSSQVIGTELRISWPIPTDTQISLESVIRDVLKLIQRHYQRNDIYIVIVMTGNHTLSGLGFQLNNSFVPIGYGSTIPQNQLEIHCCLPVHKPAN